MNGWERIDPATPGLYARRPDLDPDGTGFFHLVGHIDATTNQLAEMLGEPDRRPDPDAKTELAWTLRFTDGAVAHVYNYHDGGRRPLPPRDTLVCWHVGGHTGDVFARVAALLETPQQ